MNILIRCDSSNTIGLGHLNRSLILAKKYSEKNKIFFATLNLQGNQNQLIIENDFINISLKDNSIQVLKNTILQYNIEMLIIDHYQIDYNFEYSLKQILPTLKLMVIDDVYNKHYCDILLNHNISAKKTKYNNLVPSFCTILCGSKYTLIRNEFLKIKPIHKNNKKHILLIFGASDNQNLSLKVFNILKRYKNIHINIATTSANIHLPNLVTRFRNHFQTTLHIDSQNIAKLMQQSKLIITTTSSTIHEVLFLRKRFIGIKVAKNQTKMYLYLKKKNYPVLEKYNKIQLNKFISKELSEI